MSSSVANHTAGERPERSRNAKAQARHRAKRKAYIDQLEQTVTKLQIAVGFSSEQIAALPPPLLKIRELEQDNARLQKENDELRRLLTDPSSSRILPSESLRRPSIGAYQDGRSSDRDYKRRRSSQEGVYISPSDTPPHGSDTSRPPPPLTIPQPMSHHYGNGLSSSAHGHSAQSSLFGGLHPPTFQMPNTPSASSATSSPPFSPVQMQNSSSHLPIDHRSHISDHHSMSNYSQPTSHYSSVKVEDDHYNQSTSHGGHHSPMQYSYSNSTSQSHSSMDWHNTYPSERAHLHR